MALQVHIFGKIKERGITTTGLPGYINHFCDRNRLYHSNKIQPQEMLTNYEQKVLGRSQDRHTTFLRNWKQKSRNHKTETNFRYWLRLTSLSAYGVIFLDKKIFIYQGTTGL